MYRYLISFVLAMLVCFSVAQSAVAGPMNLVVNGGFETGSFTGWTVTTTSSESDIVVSSNPVAHAGTYAADFGAINAADTISQNITTIKGGSYTVSFWLEQLGTGDNGFTAYWGSTPVLSLNNTGAFGWTEYSFTETATGTSTSIAFSGWDAPSFYALDDVSAVVPEPGVLALLSFALPFLAGVVYRRRRAKA
ncbi:MAG: PEP-CTERM sorting domain-containing protein [Thermoguttaceae bacterium]